MFTYIRAGMHMKAMPSITLEQNILRKIATNCYWVVQEHCLVKCAVHFTIPRAPTNVWGLSSERRGGYFSWQNLALAVACRVSKDQPPEKKFMLDVYINATSRKPLASQLLFQSSKGANNRVILPKLMVPRVWVALFRSFILKEGILKPFCLDPYVQPILRGTLLQI
ncbi:hypothetical protein K435DRAFT_799652 [Dendrothele bispora CBS 962.96]|uniref:Uncharacterized protein n=1 Tax=Dendrothele bispora (strain CBS 962.96) TaxID=1314807 RepID=A0A4S8LVZ2_DENBC|nr:hypothetical protein K435DRAFT_799652 [Dendrothele bispora CBS 962.96]